MSPIPFPAQSAFQCDAASPAIDAADHVQGVCAAAGDPATLIGLALSFSRQGPKPGVDVPQLILDRLAIHGRYGNPACRMVLDYLFHRSRSVGAKDLNRPDAASLERPRASQPVRHRSQLDRVLSALASVPSVEPNELQQRPKRKSREPLAEIVSAKSPGTDGEMSHG
jgi:hypothetical protein